MGHLLNVKGDNAQKGKRNEELRSDGNCGYPRRRLGRRAADSPRDGRSRWGEHGSTRPKEHTNPGARSKMMQWTRPLTASPGNRTRPRRRHFRPERKRFADRVSLFLSFFTKTGRKNNTAAISGRLCTAHEPELDEPLQEGKLQERPICPTRSSSSCRRFQCDRIARRVSRFDDNGWVIGRRRGWLCVTGPLLIRCASVASMSRRA